MGFNIVHNYLMEWLTHLSAQLGHYEMLFIDPEKLLMAMNDHIFGNFPSDCHRISDAPIDTDLTDCFQSIGITDGIQVQLQVIRNGNCFGNTFPCFVFL